MKRSMGILLTLVLGACSQSPNEAETTTPVKPIEPTTQTESVISIYAAAIASAAGFVQDGQSDVLRNADDDYAKSVFDSGVRGKTDRFIMRFVKAE